MRALIVEDESRIARNLQRALETVPSFAADVLGDGLEAWERLRSGEPYDLLLLDRMLPGMDGLDLLQRLRALGSRVPVLILTALGTKEDIVQGLDYGCDDYLVKPYDTGELLARCKALVRRGQEHPAPVLQVADLCVYTRTHAVMRGARAMELPALEYRLLEYLAFRPGAVVSKAELLEHLYDYNWEKFSNVVEHYIWSLRSKLEAKGEAPSTRCAGYRPEGPSGTSAPPRLCLRLRPRSSSPYRRMAGRGMERRKTSLDQVEIQAGNCSPRRRCGQTAGGHQPHPSPPVRAVPSGRQGRDPWEFPRDGRREWFGPYLEDPRSSGGRGAVRCRVLDAAKRSGTPRIRTLPRSAHRVLLVQPLAERSTGSFARRPPPPSRPPAHGLLWASIRAAPACAR
jgi:two-component system response regulator PhoP